MAANRKSFDIFFDASCSEWTDDPMKNLETLVMVERLTNKTIKLRGYMYVYEVLRALGAPRNIIREAHNSKLGWEKKYAEGHAEFDIFNKVRNKDFLDGYEDVILIKMNVDGVIRRKRCWISW